MPHAGFPGPLTARKEILDTLPIADVMVPVEVYLCLELMAHEFGGIGALHMYADEQKECPHCLLGYMSYATGNDFTEILALLKEAEARAAGGDPVPHELSTQVMLNDRAVRRINARKGTHPEAKVSWDEYVEERRWVPDV